MDKEIKEWLKSALDWLRRAGADYADARYLDRETESITVRNEQVAALSRKGGSRLRGPRPLPGLMGVRRLGRALGG